MAMNNPASQPVLIVAGPTGSGKSALAIDAAVEFGGAVINADSMQVYRELRLLTARPSAEDEARVPHRLFGVLPAAEACSVGRWLAMAADEIAAAWAEGRLPIVVGGTGLYLKALTNGLVPVPEIPEAVRGEARALHRRLGGEAFKDALALLDPGAAARLPAGDSQRLIRAYEVVAATGRTLADWQRQAPTAAAVDARFATIVLSPPRETLYAAVDARFDAMIAAGVLDEVRALVALGLDPALPAMKAVGVKELAAHLRGETGLEEACNAARKATRNFAKRQWTWLRHQLDSDEQVSEQYSERISPRLFSFIRQFVLTRRS
jgi:tRNA dimethylallyltransferase